MKTLCLLGAGKVGLGSLVGATVGSMIGHHFGGPGGAIVGFAGGFFAPDLFRLSTLRAAFNTIRPLLTQNKGLSPTDPQHNLNEEHDVMNIAKTLAFLAVLATIWGVT
jgi:hypothetical protein